nr:hypothetical protein [Actinomycetota bacterium]
MIGRPGLVLAAVGLAAVTGCAPSATAGAGAAKRPTSVTPIAGHPAVLRCPATRPHAENTMVDYVDFVMLGGREYISAGPPATIPTAMLGAPVGSVRCQLDKIKPAVDYRSRDGDAAILPAGTRLYAVRGYPASFRLAAVARGRARLYEVDTAPAARRGVDLLPLRGLVTRITVLRDSGNGSSKIITLGVVTDPAQIRALIDALLAAPVNQKVQPHSWPPLLLSFNLRDGTTVLRSWYVKDAEVSRGIKAPPSFTAALLPRSSTAP